VTPEAGTTRDVLEGTIVVAGVPVRLLDTAGLGTPRDHIDAEGMRRARHAIEQSDVVIAVVDGSRPHEPNEWSFSDVVGGKPAIVVLSKSDLPSHSGTAAQFEAVRSSVKTPGGLDELLSRLVARVEQCAGRDSDETAVVASIRQIELLEMLTRSIRNAAALLFTEPLEIGLIELKSGLEAVSALLGIEVGDSVLDTVFARFCVGK
jgi:tRNA modification GTPase